MELNQLFTRPARLQPFVTALADKIVRHRVDTVYGPLTGGAFLAQAIAQRTDDPSQVSQYTMKVGRDANRHLAVLAFTLNSGPNVNKSILAEGISLIIVEQDIVQALKAVARVYCLQEGRVALAGAAKELTREAIAAAYFGV